MSSRKNTSHKRERIGIVGQGFVGSAVREGLSHAYKVETYDRNKEIATRADKVVGFWGTENLKPTRGTKHTLEHAKSLGKDVSYVAVNKGNFPKGWRD